MLSRGDGGIPLGFPFRSLCLLGGSGDGVGCGGPARGRRRRLQRVFGVCRVPCCIDPRVAVFQREMGQQVEIYGAAIVQMVYGYMDADACRKRHRNYVKRQKRAAGKRALLEWRSVEMRADEYREGQERRREKAESSRKPQTPTASGYSRRFENEWRAFEKKYRGRYEYQAKNQSYARNAADTEDPTSGATGGTYDSGYGESESARYRLHFWSSAWRGVGGDWDYGANSRWETPYQTWTRSDYNNNIIGSPADRLVLGLSPAGPLSLEELKLAFRQCALTWHPDRHDGDQKLVAEAKFKRVGDAYRTLRELL